MTRRLLPRRAPEDMVARRYEPDAATFERAREIVDSVRAGGEPALRRWAAELDGLAPDAPLVLARDLLEEAWCELDTTTRDLLTRTAERIAAFARYQRRCLVDLDLPLPGGAAGHTVLPLERAGCYAPGGRVPLPSSVLMTAVTAREAGVESIWVASPRPQPAVLAAAWIAGAEAVVVVGGAQAIAALAFGAGPVPACDIVVGPGNRWVEAAKRLVSGWVRTGPQAGPSELVVVADASANPSQAAADLLAQAEHDPDARVWLVALDEATLEAVEAALARQLDALDRAAEHTASTSAGVARTALASSGAVVVPNLDEAAALCDRLAPEHLKLAVADPKGLATRLRHAGALFLGTHTSVVLGDYGAGPNHVLPTGGAARSFAGLSVFDFLRIRTWLRINDPTAAGPLFTDTAALAEVEGLPAHAMAARTAS
ncbi:MAG: histidinol dehydrogenase [Thermoanaerobaculia bacterium]